ncbi:MAG: hypothetical protein WBA42_20595 [Mesorhizobium sp.]
MTELGIFERELILTYDVTGCFSALGDKLRWRDVPRILRAAGIQPYVLESKKTLVWKRREVEPPIAAA